MVVRQKLIPNFLKRLSETIFLDSAPEQSLQWKFTPAEAIIPKNVFKNNFFKNKDIGVIINTETVGHLRNIGIDVNRIWAFVENDERYEIAKALGVKEKNIRKITKLGKKIMMTEENNIGNEDKKFDLVMVNSDFKILKETRQLCYRLTKKHIIMISDSAYYHNHTERLKDVEHYYNMGNVFHDYGTAKVGAVLSIFNVNGSKTLKVYDKKGSSVVYDVDKKGLPKTPPGNNLSEWLWAEDVLSKNLPGYNNAEKGVVERKTVKFKENGIKIFFTAGKRDEKFNETNFADQNLVKKWNTNTETQKQKGMSMNTKFWTTGQLNEEEKAKGGYGKHKIVATHASPDGSGFIPMKYVDKEGVCGTNCWWIECKSKKDAEAEIEYFQSQKVIKLIRSLKSNAISNSKSVWEKIPRKEYNHRWS